MDAEQIATLERLEQAATPGPWAYEHTAEKSNDWAVGQAFNEDGTAIAGRIDSSLEWLEDVVIERRLVGSCESSSAKIADAALIAAMRNALPDLLAAAKEHARLRELLGAVVEHARPAFRGTPYRAALDAARAALSPRPETPPGSTPTGRQE
jgi:hypothetical protein